MSFHGGFLGVLFAMFIYAQKQNRKFFAVMDFLAPLTPIGLAAGRLGNFINGELWGRTTDLPWGMVFPGAGEQGRHPSQLYEFFSKASYYSLLSGFIRPGPDHAWRYPVCSPYATGHSALSLSSPGNPMPTWSLSLSVG
jgi:phosphatidylglycerol:prolipoprotein diacylglycerol transferase